MQLSPPSQNVKYKHYVCFSGFPYLGHLDMKQICENKKSFVLAKCLFSAVKDMESSAIVDFAAYALINVLF